MSFHVCYWKVRDYFGINAASMRAVPVGPGSTMGRRRQRFRWGLRLALFALAVQAAIPFLIAGELRAFGDLLDAPICFHSGATQSPHQDCPPTACPLCAALGAASTTGPLAAGAAPIPPSVATLALTRTTSTQIALSAETSPYRSRAPPQA